MRQRSVDASRFSMVPRSDVPRSAFDVVTTHKTTFDAGWLVPIYVDEVLPGDSFRLRLTAFARLATPIVPLMDNLVLESFFFFIPNRLLWSNWERFMGEQNSPSDSTEFLVPVVPVQEDQAPVGSLPDYFGITFAAGSDGAIFVSALPFRAYNQVWNDWFRDQDLQTLVDVNTDDGPDVLADYVILHRGKRHDYFTTARPWPRKPNQNAHMGTDPNIEGAFFTFPHAGAPVSGLAVGTGSVAAVGGTRKQTGGRTTALPLEFDSSATPFYMQSDVNNFPNVRVLINDIRLANAVSLMMEKNARGGTRYAEIVRSHFGVISPDARLQRTEYLGGGRTQITINPVAQTSASKAEGETAGGTTVLGELAGVGTAVANGDGFSQSFTEHGILLGLVSVRADMTYQQGINRMWFRRTRYDFFWPGLAHLGEQAVLRREIYVVGDQALDETVFGYQERWSEYRFKQGRISGRFRSTAPQTLDVWHLAQNFTAPPVLNDVFIIENPPVDRVLQVGGQDYEQFLFDSVMDIRMTRPMPMHSIPGLGPRL